MVSLCSGLVVKAGVVLNSNILMFPFDFFVSFLLSGSRSILAVFNSLPQNPQIPVFPAAYVESVSLRFLPYVQYIFISTDWPLHVFVWFHLVFALATLLSVVSIQSTNCFIVWRVCSFKDVLQLAPTLKWCLATERLWWFPIPKDISQMVSAHQASPLLFLRDSSFRCNMVQWSTTATASPRREQGWIGKTNPGINAQWIRSRIYQ